MKPTVLLCLFLTCALLTLGAEAAGQAETILHAFDNTDGGWSIAPLVYDQPSNSFYGTTAIGGAMNNGVVFQLTQDSSGNWFETVIYSFLGIFSGDCSEANSALAVEHKNGQIAALYGTCDFGGAYNSGAVFQLEARPDGTWKERIIHSFNFPTDGGDPRGGVVLGKNSALYGTTNVGGTGGGGTVYQLTRAHGAWTKTTLYNFAGPSDPEGRLVFDKVGALYGTTTEGGPTFSGTVFQLAPASGGTWTYNLLYTFSGLSGNGDGADPRGALIVDANGSLYGTTESGGIAGLGTVFRLDPPAPGQTSWTETQLYLFLDVGDGGAPVGGPIFGRPGVLYGTTSGGGSLFGGSVFQLTQAGTGLWTKRTLWSFGGANDGTAPWSTLLLHEGALYGTTENGGLYSEGIVFQITP